MSDLDAGLEELLAGVRAPGVYRWHALAGLPEVRDAIEGAGWGFAHLGGWTASGKQAVLGGLGRALDFPAYYGQNLDALVDCLRDLPGPVVLVWDHWSRFARADDASFGVVLDVLADRAHAPVVDKAPAFATLLWGEGPATGVRSLD